MLVVLPTVGFPQSTNKSQTAWDWILNLPAQKTTALTSNQLDRLLAMAVAQHWNLFDLLDEIQPRLAEHEIRVWVSGDSLRSAALRYRLGGHRVDTLFPLPLLIDLSVGSTATGEPAVVAHLTQPTSGFLELGDFHLSTEYGFQNVEGKALAGAFGVQVKNGFFRWNLDKIVRVPDPRGLGDPNFIAIHLKGFFRPKRWQIDPVSVRPTPLSATHS